MFILNRSNLTELDTSASTVFASLNYLMNSRFVNSLSNAISNISAHYDISNTMFEVNLKHHHRKLELTSPVIRAVVSVKGHDLLLRHF